MDYRGVCPTLNAFDNTGDSRATVLIIDGTRVDDVRVYEGPVQTLKERMGTGGNNVPVIAMAIPIQDGREIDKKQNGLGISADGEPMYTLDQTGAQSVAVAYPIDTRNALRDPDKYDAQNRQGLGIGNDGDPMSTLTAAHVNAVAYDEYNDSLGGDVHHALRAGTKQSTGVLTSMQVRRLTPTECERLMGWQDLHTLYRADGKQNADSTRYKMCGNGIASPVAQWIGEQLISSGLFN